MPPAAAALNLDTTPPARRRPPKLAAALIDTLVARVRGGLLGAGQKLPTEAALVVEFGVSRSVVREALARLEASGLVSTHQGIGTFVLADAAPAPAAALPAFDAGERDLFELRLGLLTEAAGLAAKRRTPADLAALRACIEALAALPPGEHGAAEWRFQLAVARAASNPQFAAALHALAQGDARATACRADNAGRLEEFESLLAAIAGQDSEAARAAMRTHLHNGLRRMQAAAPPAL